jgi:tellurite resistance protein TehA-like permease
MFALFGIGIAALIGAYRFAAETPPEGTRSLTVPAILVVISILCFAVAAAMALTLRKEA